MKKRRTESDSEDERQSELLGKKKSSKSNLDGASLLAAQRAAYLESGKASRGAKAAMASAMQASKKKKGTKKEGDEALVGMLEHFKDELREARQIAEQEAKLKAKEAAPEKLDGYAGEILEEEENEDDNDMSFMTHKLVFRKDVVRVFTPVAAV